jgi:hypothetical protein
MKKSQVIIACLSIVIGYISATALNRPSSAQPLAPQRVGQEVAVWRYQLTVPTVGGFSGVMILTDTATGRCWIRGNYQGANWQDLGLPPDQK